MHTAVNKSEKSEREVAYGDLVARWSCATKSQAWHWGTGELSWPVVKSGGYTVFHHLTTLCEITYIVSRLIMIINLTGTCHHHFASLRTA